MIVDVAFHWMLDMSGALTLACLLRGCKNPAHQHKPLVRWLSQHVWVAQSFAALLIAYTTVRLWG